MIPAIALPFDFEQPAWLWLCVLVPVMIAVSLRSLAGLDPVRRVLALAARSALIILLACCLAGIVRVQRNKDLTVLFLMDRSYSVESQLQVQDKFVRDATEHIPPNDRVGMIDFARDAFLQQLPMHGGYFVPPGRLEAMPNTDRTNVASALRLAMAMFPHDSAKRIILMSDGNDNMGDVLSEAKRAQADGIPIDIVPLVYEHRNEVFFDKMIAPTHAEPGEQISLRMVLKTQRRVTGRISVFQNGKLVDLPADAARVELMPGTNAFSIKLAVNAAGAHTFEATFSPDDSSMDATSINNTATGFTFVSGAGRVLLISADPQFDFPLVEAMRSENVKVDVKTTSQLGNFGLLQMMTYSTIILANVPAAAFTDQQQQQLAVYVKDMGSGLIMLGGDEGFGAGGWIGSPIEEVMPITFEIKHKRVIPRGALVLIMHSCEIARGNFWGKAMAKKSVDTISSRDYIGVLAYTYSPGGANWEVPLGLNTNKNAVKARIDRMQNGDMPDFGRTMQMAYNELTSGRGRDAAQKHVIILSDGDAQPPSASLLKSYVEAKITVSTIGIGWGGAHVMASSLQNIARTTGGKFYRAQNPRQLPQIFSKESKVVRRPLISDEPFQPQVLHAFSELLAGVGRTSGSIPRLGGMVLTSPKQSPNVLIPLIRATEDGEDPVLIHWQYELGKTVAFTSGYWPKWGRNWTAWSQFARFWAQIVRWTMRQETPANFDTYTKIDGERGRIIIDALDKDATYLNGLQLQANVVSPDHKPVPLSFIQTGPGHYEAEVEISKAGQYLANVQVVDAAGKSLGMIRTGLSVPFSPEYRDLVPNEALLRQVAEVTGGRWLGGLGADADAFSHDLPPTEAKRSAWEWVLAWLLLPAFLLDVAVRRLASWLALSIAAEVVVLVVLLFGLDLIHAPPWGVLGAFLLAELIGWTIRFRHIGPLFDWLTHSVAALGQAGDRSAASLEKLRTTRDRVREGFQTDEPDDSATAARVAKRRFDGGGEQATHSVGDLDEALGGAKPGGVPSTKRPPAGAAPRVSEQPDETTMSRLLRAKKRTQHDDEKKD